MKKNIILPFHKYYQNLEIINNIRFTTREIDILSWLTSGKTGKTAAVFLSISPKTLETHKRNIMRKIECNSREGIVNFIEKSGKIEVVRKLYKSLMIQKELEKYLEKISTVIKEKSVTCYFYGLVEQIKLQPLQNNLGLAGIKIINIIGKSISTSEYENKENCYHIYFVDNEEYQKFDQSIVQGTKNVIFLYLTEEISENFKKVADNVVSLTFNIENYYFSFLELLQKLLPDKKLEAILEEAKQQYDNLEKNSVEDYLSFRSPEDKLRPGTRLYRYPLNDFLRKNIVLLSFIFFSFLVVGLFAASRTQMNRIVYPGLIVPHDSVFLKRPEIIKSIEESLKSSKSIQTVALIGIGGAGKTTIARQYAHQQNTNIIWEINAEKESSLVDSFESLSYFLAKTDEDKKILKELKEISNYKERNEKIFSFVKARLKMQQQWFLIYDNVENFSDIQKYFPTDPEIWGKGKIIITTRDSNIASNSHINYVLSIGELTEQEKLDLFMNIMMHGNAYTSLSMQKNYIHEFLTKLPPFPLDISTAAHYIKTTNIYYDEYLKRLSEYDVDFDDTQENIIKASTEYNKTRQKIILLTLNTLININKDFKELLLFITILDSQNIPRDLLELFKDKFIIDKFTYNLKKYSFIINESSVRSSTCFSIHRSLQSIGLASINKILSSTESKQIVLNISQTLKKYANNAISAEDFSKFQFVANHCSAFLTHENLLNDTVKKEIESELGCVYFYLGDYTKAIQMLERSLEDLKRNDNKNYTQFTQTISYLGMIYGEQGDYDRAKDLLEESLSIYRKYLPENYLGIARALSYLGMNYREQGDYDRAKDLLEESLSIYRKYLPENHVGIARALSYLGINCREQGNYDKAKDLLEESLSIYRKYFPENFTFIAQTLGYLGIVYRELGDYRKAKDILEESTSIYRKYLPESFLDVAANLMHLGSIYRELGYYKRAVDVLEESVKINKEHISENNIDLAEALTHLGEIYRTIGNYKKAKILFEDSLSMMKMYVPKDQIDIGWVLTILGDIYKNQGNYDKAKELLEESLRIQQMNYPEDHIDVAWTRAVLADVYGHLGQYEQAAQYYEKSVIAYERHFKFEEGQESHVKMGWIFLYLGNFYKNAGQYGKAEEFLEKSLKIYEKHFGKNHIETTRLLKNIGQVYLLKGDIPAAEKLIKEALKIFQKNQHSESYTCLENLAEICMIRSIEANKRNNIIQSNNFKKQAVDYLKMALEDLKTYYPEDSQHIIRIQLNLKEILLNK